LGKHNPKNGPDLIQFKFIATLIIKYSMMVKFLQHTNP